MIMFQRSNLMQYDFFQDKLRVMLGRSTIPSEIEKPPHSRLRHPQVRIEKILEQAQLRSSVKAAIGRDCEKNYTSND